MPGSCGEKGLTKRQKTADPNLFSVTQSLLEPTLQASYIVMREFLQGNTQTQAVATLEIQKKPQILFT